MGRVAHAPPSAGLKKPGEQHFAGVTPKRDTIDPDRGQAGRNFSSEITVAETGLDHILELTREPTTILQEDDAAAPERLSLLVDGIRPAPILDCTRPSAIGGGKSLEKQGWMP